MTGRDDEGERSGFLSRWSRMKRDAGRPEETVQEAAVPVSIEPPPEETMDDDAITEEEIAALPPVESVTDRAGLDPFFRKGVPAALRNAARRRMWMMNPKISTYLDVARDYAYDWNTPGGVPGSGGPLAPGMAAQLVEKMISRGEWRKAAEAEPAAATTGGEAHEPPAETPPDAPAEEDEATEAEDGSESPRERQDESSPDPFSHLDDTRTFVQYDPPHDKAGDAAENPAVTPRRHGRATPR